MLRRLSAHARCCFDVFLLFRIKVRFSQQVKESLNAIEWCPKVMTKHSPKLFTFPDSCAGWPWHVQKWSNSDSLHGLI